MEGPLISVALCTYNGEKYIKQQFDSILNQTYKNLEIIVVDDASTDNTFDIIKTYATFDNRIKCFKNDVNLGFNKNFEKALNITSGEYIAISDQDDVWVPGKLASLLGHIADNWLVFSNSSYTGDGQGKLLNNFRLPASYKGFLFRNYVTGHTVLIRREFLTCILPFPENGFYDWWMGFVATYHHKITFLDEVLTYYRVHEESVIQRRQHLGKPPELVEFETNVAMMDAFEKYKNLKPADKTFIKQIKNAYEQKARGTRSIQLMKIVHKYYLELFPNRKPWKYFTKLIFAFKFSKSIK